ncbi:MAG: hypothetical protein ACJ8C4_06205 [Gemmataceae bacterium]
MGRNMFAEAEIDLIEELRLRRWARENYVVPESRDRTWHPIVHDEMSNKDLEATRSFGYQTSEA